MLPSLDLTNILMLIVGILIALTIHEMMHALVGFKLGDDTAAEEGRISLNPLKHIDPLMTVVLPIATIILLGTPILAAKPVPFNPERVRWGDYGAALIALAGPFSNLVLAIAGSLAMHFVTGSNTLLFQFIATFTVLNVSLFVFNMIPIPPLDGSRLLYAFAPDPVRRFMESLEQVGLFIVFGLILVGFGSVVSQWVSVVLNLLP